jgi:hypothetical protein
MFGPLLATFFLAFSVWNPSCFQPHPAPGHHGLGMWCSWYDNPQFREPRSTPSAMAAIGGSAVDALNQRVQHACDLFGLLDKPAESPVRLPALASSESLSFT